MLSLPSLTHPLLLADVKSEEGAEPPAVTEFGTSSNCRGGAERRKNSKAERGETFRDGRVLEQPNDACEDRVHPCS